MTRAPRCWLGVLGLFAVATVGLGPPARAQGTASHRYAVIVGANRAAPGRRDLRFAHDDAQAVADILIRLGDFPYENVNVLLDPEPAHILATLDSVLARESPANDALLVFLLLGSRRRRRALPERPRALARVAAPAARRQARRRPHRRHRRLPRRRLDGRQGAQAGAALPRRVARRPREPWLGADLVELGRRGRA